MDLQFMYSHVKWFTDKVDTPLPMSDVLTGAFWLWFIVTVAGLLLSSFFNNRMLSVGWIGKLEETLGKFKPYTTIVLRVGLGIALLMQMWNHSYLAPELESHDPWIRVLMICAILGLLLSRTLQITGLLILVLYVEAVWQYGFFHALDYVFYMGIAYYLLVAATRWKDTAIPVLYSLTGFSLAWVGIEKLTMPELTYNIIRDFNVPTFGFSMEHFVIISAFIELGLAWAFIMGILNRFVAVLVTFVFVMTTMVFGMKEVVGHTIVHTLLIMFIIQGEGAFRTPFEFHRSAAMRYTFVVVNFCILLFGLMVLYIWMGGIH